MSLKHELKLIGQGVVDALNPKIWAADPACSVFGWQHEQLIFDLFGLDTRQRNIVRERRRMKVTLKQNWWAVLEYYKWRCAKCGVQNWRNKETGKPRMQVDHIVSLYEFGKTEWSNLQVLCAPHNRQKGTRTVDYRK